MVYKRSKSVANYEGVTPIELMDVDRIVELIEKYRLGLKPVTLFEIDQVFSKALLNITAINQI